MKKILCAALSVIILLGCESDNDTLLNDNVEISTVQSTLSKIIYKNEEYSINEASTLFVNNRTLLQFDFRPTEGYLFDNDKDAIEFSNINFKKQYPLLKRMLSEELEGVDFKGEISKSQSKTAKTLVSSFGLQIIDVNCTAPPPYNIFVIDLDSYPTGSLQAYSTMGYYAASFDLTVPADGYIGLSYNFFSNSCLHNVYVATYSQCHDVYYPMSSSCSGPKLASYISWGSGYY